MRDILQKISRLKDFIINMNQYKSESNAWDLLR